MVDKTFYTLTLSHGQKIVADQSRVVLMGFGKSFSEDLPQVSRQSTLIYEARHSDCNGGVTETHVSDLRRQVNIHGQEKGLLKAFGFKALPEGVWISS